MRLFHAPARGATPAGRCCKDGTGNFNPRPPRGGRRYVSYGPRPRHRFQSTPPARGATWSVCNKHPLYGYFNPRPPRAGRLLYGRSAYFSWYFNPRPPRGGRRVRLRQQPEGIGNFNPRPPRGGRLGLLPHLLHALGFQSTPPARGATVKMKVRRWSMSISIHAPREGGDSRMYTLSAASKISIHAPREGGDGGINYPPPYKEDFNPRPPRGGRRFVRIVSLSLPIISIHAPPRGGRP